MFEDGSVMKNPICQACDNEERKRKGFVCDKIKLQDKLIYRCVHNQSFLKLDMLIYYLKIVTNAMKSKFDEMFFIDLFSGPGYCFNRDYDEFRDGSSLIAQGVANPFSKYIFVDRDQNILNALKLRSENNYPKLKHRVKLKQLDANKDIMNIVDEIKDSSSLTTVFLDPNGFDIHYSTVEKLSKLERVDLIINFAILDLKRNAKTYRETNDKANLVFGCNDWPESKLEWLTFYRKRLRDLGFIAVEDDVEPKMTIKTKTGGSIYHLIYASKNKMGLKFWEEAKYYVRQDLDLFDKRRINK